MQLRQSLVFLALAGIVSAAGCATLLDTAIDRAAERTGERVGTAIGDRVGDAIVRQYSPMFLSWYTSYLFNMAFGAGGYEVGEAYQPGQWTRWQLAGQPGPKGRSWMERAFLARVDEGKEWWRVKFFDGESGDTTTMEALFTKDRGQILRLRMQVPGEAPKEMPVEEQTYVPPHRLTKESLEGAKVGSESITVPAGTFQADHLRFGQPGQGTWEWWLSKKVPGGVVRYTSTGAKGEGEAPKDAKGLDDTWTLDLEAFGDGAKSELGVL